MARPHLEVADVLNAYGDAYIAHHRGHLSRGQLKVMGAIRACRTAALGGHVARCEGCDHVEIAYNSCRNRHCPKCQGQVARAWLEQRQADLLPVPYYHVVFTLPAPVAAVAFQNKAVVYDLLFRTAADTLLTIAADPRHLGARIGLTRLEPAPRGTGLALRAVPVAAGVVGDLRVRAVLAARNMPAESRRAAVLDRRHHLQLAEAYTAGIGFAPCRSVAAEDIRDLQRRARHAPRSRWAALSPRACA